MVSWRGFWEFVKRTAVRLAKYTAITMFFGPTFVAYWEDRPVVLGPISYPIGYYMSWQDTRYSDGYSQKRFDTVQVGDSMESVRSKLGEPLWSNEPSKVDNTIVHWYSKSGPRSNYWTAVNIWFDRNGKVVRKQLYADD
jgi:hypothetical protein